ncbi:MAG: serine/threonine protein kinase [Deltaproteobacteria bacterium]|nr:serine/threonine protein kinase [Deltaproteobacteria bacterium]
MYDDDDDDEFATTVDAGLYTKRPVPDYDVLAKFGPFEILGRIARGGMAEVYLARDKNPDGTSRHVVLKRVLPEYEGNPEFLEMFLEEGKMASRLYHPNVCHVYEAGDVDGATFMTLEWVYGVPLRKVIRLAWDGDGIPTPIGAKIISKVAAALHYVHNAKGVQGRPLNIIHRDVSPHNIMVSWEGSVKLLDFGIAKTTATAQTDAGVLKGKYSYLSPEQARGQRVDPRSDIFALGICLYETLTGKPLYHRDTVLNTLTAVAEEPVPSAREVNPEVSAGLDAVVKRALAKDPTERFTTAGEMQEAIDEALIAEAAFVDPKVIKGFLDKTFDANDKLPLPKRAEKLTGSFQTGTPSSMSGSFGPFGKRPRGKADQSQEDAAAAVAANGPPIRPGAAGPTVAPPRRTSGSPEGPDDLVIEIDIEADAIVESDPNEGKPVPGPTVSFRTDVATAPKKRSPMMWALGVLFVALGIGMGALTAWLAR